MITSLKKLDKFIDKNRETINMLLEMKVPEHPIDHDNVRSWVELHRAREANAVTREANAVTSEANAVTSEANAVTSEANAVTSEVDPVSIDIISKVIANNIINVSYQNILDKLNQLVNELNIVYTEREKRVRGVGLYLYIPDNMFKSNFVFTILFYYLCGLKEIRFRDLIGGKQLTLNKNDYIVLVDDATYSGGQIYNHIVRINMTIKQGIGLEPNYFLAIPYISETAKQLISSTNTQRVYVIYPSSSTSFKSIRSYIEDEYEICLDDSYDDFNFLFDQHLLYLDFKLPDSVSIPQTIFAYGYRIDDDLDKRHYSSDDLLTFFKNCEGFYKRNLHITKGVSDIKDEDIIGEICPKPFYTDIDWL